MSSPTPFFEPLDESSLRITIKSEEEIRHEVLFEAEVTSVNYRPLFVGSAFPKRRFILALIFVSFFCSILVARAAWMQIGEGDMYTILAESNRLRTISLWPLRGIIHDRTGAILAENAPRFQATVIPRFVPLDPEERERVVGEASRLLGKSYADLLAIVSVTSTAQDEEVIIADSVPYTQAIAYDITLPRLPGFHLQAHPMRHYPWSDRVQSLSHVLGYVGRLSPEEYGAKKTQGYRRADEIGKTGVERSYETELRGTLGSRMNEVDARGSVKGFAGELSPQNGEDLKLTLDVHLQEAAELALLTQIERAKAKRGSVVATDPRDGSVLALVSWPSYSNNDFAGTVSSTVYQALVQDPERPLFPRAIAGAYPSGSTIKIAISLAALTEKIITPDTTVVSSGGVRLGAWFFPDWKAGGHGVTNVRKAIANSVNTFYYYIGGGLGSFQGLGVDRLSTWMKTFGLSSKTGIDLSGENAGFVPTKKWREERGGHWYIGDTYNLSIGQGDLLVTPLQVNAYTTTIAMLGKWFVPHVVEKPVVERPPIEADVANFQVVREGMRDCVTGGSCRSLSDLPMPTGAKTGTAQGHDDKNTHAWFTAFAPYDGPEIVVTVLIEEGGEGSSFAAPVAKKVLQEWWRLKQERGGRF